MVTDNKMVFFLVAIASLLGASVVLSTISMMGDNLAYSNEKTYCPPGQGLCHADKEYCELSLYQDGSKQKCDKVKL